MRWLPRRRCQGEAGRLCGACRLPRRPVASHLLHVLGVRPGAGGPGLLLVRPQAVLWKTLLSDGLAPMRRL